jgi:antitoxin MazE
MKLAKWGNSLAVRIPAEVVEQLNLAPGEEIQFKITGEHQFQVSRDRRRLEALDAISKLAKPLLPGYKFNRDEIYDRYERGVMRRQESGVESNVEKDA